MSVKIRLAKAGKKHQVTYRIVAQDTRSKRDGKFLEVLGFYNPFNTPSLELDKEKFGRWTKIGALPTQAVKNLINEGKLIKKPAKRKLKLAQEAQAAKEAQNQQKAKTDPPAQSQENLQSEQAVEKETTASTEEQQSESTQQKTGQQTEPKTEEKTAKE